MCVETSADVPETVMALPMRLIPRVKLHSLGSSVAFCGLIPQGRCVPGRRVTVSPSCDLLIANWMVLHAIAIVPQFAIDLEYLGVTEIKIDYSARER